MTFAKNLDVLIENSFLLDVKWLLSQSPSWKRWVKYTPAGDKWPIGHLYRMLGNTVTSIEAPADSNDNVYLRHWTCKCRPHIPTGTELAYYFSRMCPGSQQIGRHFSNAILRCSFLKNIVFKFKFYWCSVSDLCLIGNNSALVRVMAWRPAGDKP